MAKYGVVLNNTVSTVVYVEADSPESAVEAAIQKGVPSLMFTDHRYPDEGDWHFPPDENNKLSEDDYVWKEG